MKDVHILELLAQTGHEIGKDIHMIMPIEEFVHKKHSHGHSGDPGSSKRIQDTSRVSIDLEQS